MLLGSPFRDEYDAVSRIRPDEFTMHDVGVIVELLKSGRLNEDYKTIATFVVTHFMPPVSLPTLRAPMAVSQPITCYAVKISYVEFFVDIHVSVSNINSSFLR